MPGRPAACTSAAGHPLPATPEVSGSIQAAEAAETLANLAIPPVLLYPC